MGKNGRKSTKMSEIWEKMGNLMPFKRVMGPNLHSMGKYRDPSENLSFGLLPKKFELTEANEISRPSVSDGSDDDDVCGRNETETSKLSLSGILNLEFEADRRPCGWQLTQVDCRH